MKAALDADCPTGAGRTSAVTSRAGGVVSKQNLVQGEIILFSEFCRRRQPERCPSRDATVRGGAMVLLANFIGSGTLADNRAIFPTTWLRRNSVGAIGRP
jgi:hypothetical protein